MNALFTSMTAQVAYDGQPAKLIELTNRRGMRVVVMDIVPLGSVALYRWAMNQEKCYLA